MKINVLSLDKILIFTLISFAITTRCKSYTYFSNLVKVPNQEGLAIDVTVAGKDVVSVILEVCLF